MRLSFWPSFGLRVFRNVCIIFPNEEGELCNRSRQYSYSCNAGTCWHRFPVKEDCNAAAHTDISTLWQHFGEDLPTMVVRVRCPQTLGHKVCKSILVGNAHISTMQELYTCLGE